jgi:hypothetical protein
MTVYFAASTHGFYEDWLHGANMPADAVALPDGLREELLDREAKDSAIGVDAKGFPIVVARPAPP